MLYSCVVIVLIFSSSAMLFHNSGIRAGSQPGSERLTHTLGGECCISSVSEYVPFQLGMKETLDI